MLTPNQSDARLLLGKFCCRICSNFDRDEDGCKMTGDRGIEWRAHRTCCGREDWHIPIEPSSTNYQEILDDLRCISQSLDAKPFISSYTKKDMVKLADFVEELLKNGNND